MCTGRYDEEFYVEIDTWSRDSATVIVPWVAAALAPNSVLDVGCGWGVWLAEFKSCGVSDVLGLDGDHLNLASLHIEPAEFRATDLLSPPALDRDFDLAVSLEVAEHLPAGTADGFVEFLTDAAPIVLFSGAIPGQGGVHHVNEQWPAYWAQRFATVGYRPIDAVRARYWDDERVAFFFAQNIVVYARDAIAPKVAANLGVSPYVDEEPRAFVHPRMFEAARDQERMRRQAPPSLSSLMRALPGAIGRAVRTPAGRRRSAPHEKLH